MVSTIGSTVLMGVLFVGVFIAVSRISARRQSPRDAPEETAEGVPVKAETTTTEYLGTIGDSPGALGAIFLLITLGAGVLAVAAVGGFVSPESLSFDPFAVAFAFMGLLVVGFLFAGTYVVTRQHGLGNAHGIAAGLVVVGGAFLLLVAAQLVFGLVGSAS